jgi:hypothetical protein
MTKEERKEAFREADKIRKNYIIGQCCSVDDLRSSLRSSLEPKTAADRNQQYDDLVQAIEYEKGERNRVTIIKMLDTKRRQLAKLSFVFILVITTSSCGKYQLIIWNGTDMIGIVYLVLFLVFIFIVWVINYIDTKLWERRRNRANKGR